VVATGLEAWTARVRARFAGAPRGTVAVAAVLVLVVAVGVLDGTPRRPLLPESAVRPTFEADRALVGTLEQTLPNGAAVFQLPVHPFPEGGPRHAMADYDPVRGYLHSRDLRWSYGGMKGREADWQLAVALLAVEHQLRAAVAVGFDGLWLDRAGYADGGAAVDAELRRLLGDPFATAHAGRLAVWDLRPLRSVLDASGDVDLDTLRHEVLAARPPA
jgi:phosphoglycerol transferase